MKRLEQLEAWLGVAREHAEHELNVSRLLEHPRCRVFHRA